MDLPDERGVRRALAFAQMLEHPHLVRCCGTWEDEKALYIVEEYATKGDLLQVGGAGGGRRAVTGMVLHCTRGLHV